MRICILTEYLSYIGGGERVYCNWANILSDRLGHEVVILSLEDTDKPFYKLSSRVIVKSLKLRPFKYYLHPVKRRLGMIWNYSSDRKCIETYLKNNHFDCVIGIATNICLLLATIKTECPRIGTEHTEYYAPIYPLRILRNFLYFKLDYLTVLTDSDCALYKRFMNNVSVMLNPLSFSITGKSHLSEKKLISIGSLSPQKSQMKMLEVAKVVKQRHPDWRLVIYGEGALRQQLESYSEQLGLKDFVEFPGSIENVQEALKDASIFLLTSKIEGFGLVLIEAMACGLPCVSFNAPGPESIIKNGENGYLVAQGDIEDMSDKICGLIENETLRKVMGNKAFNSIGEYSVDTAASSWQSLLLKMINNEDTSSNNS